MSHIFDYKHSVNVLLTLLHGEKNLTELRTAIHVKSSQGIDNAVNILEKNKLVETQIPQEMLLKIIRLTEKGKTVAEKLKEVVDIIQVRY